MHAIVRRLFSAETKLSERTPITTLLLLLLLASFLLVSGGLQCAFDCLAQADHRHSAAVRVDDCHLKVPQADPASSCANKACHQGSPQRQNLDGPQLFSLNKLQYPFSGTSRLQMPVFRAGAPLPSTPAQHPILLAVQKTDFFKPSQQLRTLRTTVLLN